MIHAIALRELFPAGSLFLDCWEGSSRFRSLVPRWFRDPRSFVEQRDLLMGRTYDRKAVASILQEQNLLFGAGPAVMANIQRLADPRALVVVGGQQAGLFGGPLYTVHKALTILSLAARLESDLGQPVVPVFWIASEDSDLAEVDRAVVSDADGGLRELRLPGDEAAKMPVSLVKLGGGLAPLLDELADVLPRTDFTSDILGSLRSSYSPERAYPQAFGAWMTALFSSRGLVMIDPSDARLKRIAMPLFQKEVAGRSPVSAAVIEQTRLLSGAGYAPQIELREGMLTLFHQGPARDAIAIQERGFALRSAGRTFSNGDLEKLLTEKPEQFTPNAVLRPLYQDSLFPTLAVVLGPSEIAYFCQLPLAYKGMNIPMPVVFPRSSLTIVEPKVQKLLSKFDLSLAAVLSRGERIIDDIVRKGIPPGVFEQLSAGRTQAAEIWDNMAREIHRLDPTLDRTAQIAAGRTARQFEFMEKKILQAARRKEVTLRAQTRRLAAALAPRGGLQERTLTALPFLARYGRPVLDQAAAAIDPFAPEHRGVVIDG